ncbi:MAG: hypothetical protein GXP34_01035 [Actinobacteria bacterium]|nr:hypothetical protein [Actinomycetota bacterium]
MSVDHHGERIGAVPSQQMLDVDAALRVHLTL